MKKWIPTDAATSFSNTVGSSMHSAITVGFLAWQWNTYDCGNRQVYAGETYKRWGGGGTPSGTYVGTGAGGSSCYMQRGEISFDGGSTWYPVDIRVCYVN
jgi:hypothetical protein